MFNRFNGNTNLQFKEVTNKYTPTQQYKNDSFYATEYAEVIGVPSKPNALLN